LAKRWSAAQRRDAYKRGHALPPLTEGDEPRYPIDDCEDVDHAIRDLGRTAPGDRERVRRHIAKRAVELGCPLPDTWKLRKG
jgi:CHASE1-domain containing sensor protein